ncbi:MAG: T9SS type A sorting domain-containing protein [Ignavibacteria bacterium]|nr:T9SS type A sorting domain-containing protein [Ignavibacteria bacterium]
MKDVFSFLPLLLFLFTAHAGAQWTRLPVYAGHADRLVQNKYKPNEIFAIVQNGGIYKSADYGDTWTTVVNDLDLIWHSQYAGELAFEVAANGDFFVSTDRKFYLSRDDGKTWQRDNRIGGSNYHHNFITHKDGSIFINRSGSDFIQVSADSGKSFDTIRTPLFSGGASWSTVLVDPEDSKRIFIGGGGNSGSGGFETEMQRTTDAGLTWSTTRFPGARYLIRTMDRIPTDGGFAYLAWVDEPTMGELRKYTLLRSDDSGHTWQGRNPTGLRAGDGGSWSYAITAMYFGDTYLFCAWNALYISRDAGVTWVTLPNRGVWGMVRVPSGILASTTFDGIKLSADTGVTWRDMPGTRAFPGSAEMEVAATQNSVVYATVCDHDYLTNTGVPDDSASRAELLRSSDGGDTWEPLFSSTWLDQLTVRSRADTRYYAVAARRFIVSGTADGGTPDTLISVVDGVVRELHVGEVWPYELVALIDYGGLYAFLVSSDGGKKWRQYGVPPMQLSACRVLPSSTTTGEYAAVVRPINVNDYLGMGVWHVTESGNTWSWIYKESDLLPRLFAMCDGGRLYRHDKKQFSRTYGAVWDYDTAGMSDSDARQMFNLGWDGSMLARKGALLIGDPAGWLLYRNGYWRRLVDRMGLSIARDMPFQFDFIGDMIYAAFPKHGLYRIHVANLSTRTELPSQPDDALLSCYPNPTRGFFMLLYRLPPSSAGHLQLSDALGNIVYQWDVTAGEGSLPVDFKTISLHRDPSGLYFIRLFINSGHSISTPILYLK